MLSLVSEVCVCDFFFVRELLAAALCSGCKSSWESLIAVTLAQVLGCDPFQVCSPAGCFGVHFFHVHMNAGRALLDCS